MDDEAEEREGEQGVIDMKSLTTNRRIALARALLACAALALPSGSQAATAAPAAQKPGVSTGGFTTVGASAVTLKGTVNPYGLVTVYAFQFGTTTGYGAQMAPVSAGNGTTRIPVSQTITGLPPGVTYHYRLIATNSAGTTNGKGATFIEKIPLRFTLARTPNPTVFGSPFTVSGVLSGTGAAGRDVMLQSNPYPYIAGFNNAVGPELTDSAGRFSFSLASLLETTQFRVVTVGSPAAASSAVVARVAVGVSLNVRSTGRHGFVRMYGTVTPGEVGARVGFQAVAPRTQATDRLRHARQTGKREHVALRPRRAHPPRRSVPRVRAGEQRQAGVRPQPRHPHRLSGKRAFRGRPSPLPGRDRRTSRSAQNALVMSSHCSWDGRCCS